MLSLQSGIEKILSLKIGEIVCINISGIITGKGAKSLAVGGWKDHVHILFGMPLTTCISDFMSAVKANSSGWINEQLFVKGKFQWQSGYGAFSYAKSQRNVVINTS